MNQLDRFCCGPVNSQYCCNEQLSDETARILSLKTNLMVVFFLFREFYYQSRPSFGAGQVNARHGQYSPSKNRAVAIVVPIVGTLVVVGALIIVFLYYKKLRSEQKKSSKPSVAPRTHENYSGRTTKRSLKIKMTICFFSCSTRNKERKSEYLNVKLIEYENHLFIRLHLCVKLFLHRETKETKSTE